MNSSSGPDLRNKGLSNRFRNQISNLLEEIELSLQWDRPSILLSIYSSEVIRKQAQDALEQKLNKIGLKVKYIKVDKDNFDLGWFLSQFEQHEKVVFFISGLRWGGGRSRTNGYQALNLRRELFVSEKIRMVIWLNPREAIDLPNHAPDFWAFRHRVVEFPDDLPKTTKNTSATSSITKHEILSWRDWQINETPDGVDAKIKLRESLLAGMQVNEASLFMRAELMYTIAYLFWLKQRFDKALSYLEQGLALATHPGAISMRSKILAGIGIVNHDAKRFEKAIHAFNKALELNQEDAHAWNNLGRVFQDTIQEEKALDAYKKSTKIDPSNANAWNNLGNYHKLAGRSSDAIDAYKRSSKFDPQNEIPLINLASTHLILGQPDKAIRAFKKAIRIDPSNVVIQMKLGDIYREMNRYKDAIKSYGQAIKSDPAYFPPHIRMLVCDRALNNQKALKKHISEALPYFANQNEYLKAAFEAQKGDEKEARRLLNIALRKNIITRDEIRQNEFLNSIQNYFQTEELKTG